MGEFAEMAFERDLEAHINSTDFNPTVGDVFSFGGTLSEIGIPVAMVKKTDYKEDMIEAGYKQCNDNEIHVISYNRGGRPFIFTNVKGCITHDVKTKRETSKAVLLRIIEEGDIIRDFWVPKSLLFKKPDDDNTLVVPNFFKIKYIEKKVGNAEKFVVKNKKHIYADYQPFGEHIITRIVKSLRQVFDDCEDVETLAYQVEGEPYKSILIPDVTSVEAEIAFYLVSKDSKGIWTVEFKEFIM